MPNGEILLTLSVVTKKGVIFPTDQIFRMRGVMYLKASMREILALQNLPASPVSPLILNPLVDDYQLPEMYQTESNPLATKVLINLLLLIFLDATHACYGVTYFASGPNGHPLARAVGCRSVSVTRSGVSFKFMWIQAPCGIGGNIMGDRITKRSSRGILKEDLYAVCGGDYDYWSSWFLGINLPSRQINLVTRMRTTHLRMYWGSFCVNGLGSATGLRMWCGTKGS